MIIIVNNSKDRRLNEMQIESLLALGRALQPVYPNEDIEVHYENGSVMCTLSKDKALMG